MNHELPPEEEQAAPREILSRREALRRTVTGGLLAALGLPVGGEAAHMEEPFVPENDYPHFGYEPEEGR